MRNLNYCVQEDEKIRNVADRIIENHIEYIVVVSKSGKPKGIVTYGEALHNCDNAGDIKASDIMDTRFIAVKNLNCLEDTLEKNDYDITVPIVLVNDEGKYVEMLSDNDIITILHKNLKYARSILDNIDEGIIAIDTNNNIAFMNESYRQIHSVENDDLLGTSIREKFPESMLGSENMTRVKEPLHLNLTGATVIPSYKQIVDDENKQLGAMAIVKDYSKINDFYIGVNKMSEVNNFFNFVFNNLPEAVFCVGSDFKVVYSNKKFEEITGIKAGQELSEGVLKEAIINDAGRLKAVNAEREISLNVDSEVRKYKCIGLPLLEYNDFGDRMIVILRDITSFDRMHSEFKRRGKILDYYKQQMNKLPDEMICESENFKETIATALKVAATDATVLIEGENGVGKELIATLIHNNSRRSQKPFIPVNCGAIPESLWESEMFGYEEGAFTGAKRGGKMGVFELADGGTVFLDEIGEMSPSTQVKLLRFLQNMEIAKVGRKEIKKVDVRIVAATNKDIGQLIEEEKFRIDLYYRLNVVSINVPPLRERVDEIKPMAEKFVSMFNARYNKDVVISKEAISALEKKLWPGNIRQLRNAIEQSVIMCDGVIEKDDLPIDFEYEKNHTVAEKNYAIGDLGWNIPKHVATIERQLMEGAIEQVQGNRSKAMELLGISRKTFYKKLKDYGLE